MENETQDLTNNSALNKALVIGSKTDGQFYIENSYKRPKRLQKLM